MTLDERLKEIEWLADDSGGSYTDEAYRSMPGKIKSVLAALRLALSQRNFWINQCPPKISAAREQLADRQDAAILAALNGEGRGG